ncbi:MAG: ATP-binding protein [Burkholderiales bacterium]
MPGAVPTLSARARLRWIVAAGVVLIVAFVGSSGYDAWRLYRQALADTDRELRNLATALAEQGARSFQSVDALLRQTADWYAAAGDRVAPERANELLAGRAASLPQVRTLSIIDAQGTRRYSSRALPGELDVSDRAYFVAQRDRAATGLFVSEPIVTGAENRAALVLSRRVDDGQGRFAGVVSATVDLDDLQQFYRAIRLSAGSAINLVRDDGALIVRQASGPASVGSTFPELAGVRDPEAKQWATPGASPVDGAARFVAVARLPDLPLAVTVTRDRAVALKSWREAMVHVAVRTLTLTLIGALLISAFVHQLRRVNAGERALRRSEERYALAMEGSNEGHWDWDLATDCFFLSPKMKALHGRLEGQPVVTRAEWFAHVEIDPDDERRLDAALKDHIEARTPYFELDYRVRHPDGGWRWLLSRGRCLRDAEGKPYRFVGSASDITDRKRAEAERERLEAQLRQSQKMEAMGTLAGGIAHDFNNILGAILGYGELAQKASGEGSRVRRYLDQVMHAGGRAKALVERILVFSRSGLAERGPVHVQSVVNETLDLLAASLPPGVRLERRLAAGDAAVIGDATQLHQVVMNLCTNAMHAMRGEGLLAVVLERAEVVSRIAVSHGALSARPYVRLTVSDTGSGIAPEVLERMFDPFFTTKVVGEGTGLGLPLVHGIVGDLDGAIDVATKPGEGTAFAIWLPLAGETARPLPKAARQAPRGTGEAVMIVDDEPALVALAEEMLAELGYEPAGFESSVAALAVFRADPQRFDLVLTDEAMPELAGTELAREIRRLRAEIPVVLMSGYGGATLAARAAATGVREVLRKPLDGRDLAESLARVLGSARGVPPPL